MIAAEGQVLVVKVGGAQLTDRAARAQFADSVASARAASHTVVVVHGGGGQIRRLTDRLALGATRRVRGLRVTDHRTAEAALMVLGGQVNRTLVGALGLAGCPAVGLTGADGGLFTARALDPELGFVGTIDSVDPKPLHALTGAGFVPVVAPVAPLAPGTEGDRSAFYNINADHVVAPLALAVRADAILFLTDVEAVRDGDNQPVTSLDAPTRDALVKRGVIAGGMIPKVDTACAAASHNPRALVRIASARHDDAILRALDPTTLGTTFVSTSADNTN